MLRSKLYKIFAILIVNVTITNANKCSKITPQDNDYNLMLLYESTNLQWLPPILMAAFPAVSQRSGALSPPLIARNSLGTVKNNEIPAAAEKAT